MDPVSIAAGVVSVLLPYVVKGGEEFAKTLGKTAAEKVGGMLARLKSRWSGDGKAAEALAQFEKAPQANEARLEAVLQERLVTDAALSAELAALVDELGPQVHVFQTLKEGENVTGIAADEMTEGTASVTQQIDKGRSVTGVTIKKIGR